MLWTVRKALYRTQHAIGDFVMTVWPVPIPELLNGPGSVKKVPETIKKHGLTNVLVVTDKVLMKLNLLEGLFKALKENNITYTVYDDVQPNPTIENVENGFKLYMANNCQGFVAFGGGSPMDCAKIIGARAVNKWRSVSSFKGLVRVIWKIPPVFAIPTTSGSGSETTASAVITDPAKHLKFAIIDPKIVPRVAALDPELMTGLPLEMTSTTGMDALVHAIESYIGNIGTKFTRKNAEEAAKLVIENLEDVYKDGSNLEKRNNMALAAYYAGLAFSRTFVGYVHAIAHNVGGLYGTPHGLANSIILPHILEYCKDKAKVKLAKLAVAAGLGKEGESDEKLTQKLIDKIISMNKNMNIPTKLKDLKEEDIPLLAKMAIKEGNPTYPVPKIMNRKECEEILRQLLP
ncbi:MAG: iron-containing alcohol dehydrogenase [bacterium]|nr:iron-containing alcohol dehydrogenase [bacterium]